MPYVSDKQRRFFNANREKLEAEGVDVDEWNESTKGKDIPEKAPKKNVKKASALLFAVLQLNNLKHAMDSMGLKPTTMTPPTATPPGSGDRPKPRLGLSGPLEQTRLPSKQPVKETPALETEKTPEQIALEAGEKAGFKPVATGSQLMPSTGQ
jgi:hypothetical protein